MEHRTRDGLIAWGSALGFLLGGRTFLSLPAGAMTDGFQVGLALAAFLSMLLGIALAMFLAWIHGVDVIQRLRGRHRAQTASDPSEPMRPLRQPGERKAVVTYHGPHSDQWHDNVFLDVESDQPFYEGVGSSDAEWKRNLVQYRPSRAPKKRRKRRKLT